MKPGQRLLLSFDGEELWHERLVLAAVGRGMYVVMTPDEEIQIADLSDVSYYRLVKPNGELPLGIRRGQSY
eukprot:11608623-Karenia_brevis.AAC.1